MASWLKIEPAVSIRDQILADFVLSGICFVGETSMAIVDGQYLKVGDRIGRFVVREVRERELVIGDEEGDEILRISEPEWLDTFRQKEPAQ